jgi:hypothetical protein
MVIAEIMLSLARRYVASKSQIETKSLPFLFLLIGAGKHLLAA